MLCDAHENLVCFSRGVFLYVSGGSLLCFFVSDSLRVVAFFNGDILVTVLASRAWTDISLGREHSPGAVCCTACNVHSIFARHLTQSKELTDSHAYTQDLNENRMAGKQAQWG